MSQVTHPEGDHSQSPYGWSQHALSEETNYVKVPKTQPNMPPTEYSST